MSGVAFRTATEADLDAILGLLADDPLGKYRELKATDSKDIYINAFRAIAADPNSEMWVAEQGGTIVGCLQLTLIPGLTRQGAWRALVESVRVASHLRGQGIGKSFMRHAIVLARERGAKLVQLTSDMRRAEAHRFYKALGFSQSHAGFKLEL